MPNEIQFLFYNLPENREQVKAVIKDGSIWLTQKGMSQLFDVGIPAVNKHLSNIYSEGELDPSATISKMEIVQKEGNREIKRNIDFYNLDAIMKLQKFFSKHLFCFLLNCKNITIKD